MREREKEGEREREREREGKGDRKKTMEKYNVSNKSAQEARYHDAANDMRYLILLWQCLHKLPKKLGTIIPRM